MKTLIALVLTLLLVSAASGQVTVNISKTAIELPVPDGYRQVSIADGQLHAVFQKFGGPNQRHLDTLIPESYVPSSSELVMPKRFLRVVVEESLQRVTLTPERYQSLQNHLIAEHKSALQRFKQAKANGSWLRSPQQIEPLPMHERTAHCLSGSSRIRLSKKQRIGGEFSVIITCTFSHVLVKDKIINVLVYGQENDLEWTREASKVWIAMLLEANSKDAPLAADDSQPAPMAAEAASSMQSVVAEVEVNQSQAESTMGITPMAAASSAAAKIAEQQAAPTPAVKQPRKLNYGSVPVANPNAPPAPSAIAAQKQAERSGRLLANAILCMILLMALIRQRRKKAEAKRKVEANITTSAEENLIPRMPIIHRGSGGTVTQHDESPAQPSSVSF